MHSTSWNVTIDHGSKLWAATTIVAAILLMHWCLNRINPQLQCGIQSHEMPQHSCNDTAKES